MRSDIEDVQKRANGVEGKLAGIAASVDELRQCSDGNIWDNDKKVCSASAIRLAPSATVCTASANGLVALDDDGMPVVCNGEKEKYEALGSGSGGGILGLAENSPVASCTALEDSSPFKLKSGKFWKTKAGAVYQTHCIFADGAAPVDAGGDGSSVVKAAQSCLALNQYWGQKKKASFFLVGSGNAKRECDFASLGLPEAEGKFSGQINRFQYLVSDTMSSGSTSVLLGTARSPSPDFKPGTLVMIHQTQHSDVSKIGTWEWLIVKKYVGRELTFHTPLKRSYFSGSPGEQNGQAVVAQILTVPYAVTGKVTGKLTTLKWDGSSGGVIAIRTTQSLTVSANIDAKCAGFRGGKRHVDLDTGSHCRSHQSAGEQGESYRGMGKRDGDSAGFGCCAGPSNMWTSTGYRGRGKNNYGGGGGGAGACHGGGGAGGAHNDWTGIKQCNLRCASGKPVGGGSPECSRAGSWALRGRPYGDADNVANFGSGGGGGNSYSPRTNEDNRGGVGGGVVILEAGGDLVINEWVSVDGCQGYPLEGTSMQKRWKSVNTQDGSGGGGAGGAILLYGKSVQIGTNALQARGGICGSQDGGHPREQVGGPGANGRVVAVTEKLAGNSPLLVHRTP